MRLILSPYEMCGASAAAASAAMLGDEEEGVLTLRPGPFDSGSRDAARDAAARAPAFLRLLEQWRWASDLWGAGVFRAPPEVAPQRGGLAAALDQIAAELAAGDAPLLAATGARTLGEDEGRFLEVLCRDLLRGGADPAICLPVMALMERLAADDHSALMCGESAGLVWKPRPGSGSLFSFTMPMLIGATGTDLLRYREALCDPLSRLRAAIGAAAHEAKGESPGGAGVRLAADALAIAFAEEFGEGFPASSMDDRPIARDVLITASRAITGSAVREAMVRLERVLPTKAARPPEPGGLVNAGKAFTILRVKESAWDFGGRVRSPKMGRL